LAIINQIFMATETWHNKEDAGTESILNLTMNVNGSDILDYNLEFQEPLNSHEHTERGNAGFTLPMRIDAFDTNLLTDSSIRLGIRGDDAWAPQNVFLFGRTDDRSQVPVPLAIETDLDVWLSTDNGEGHLTTPIRLVRSGNDPPIREIRRVLLVISTGPNDDDGTDDDIELEIRGSDGTEFFREQFNDTFQADLEKNSANYYSRDVRTPFTESDLQGCRIILRILGRDAWHPYRVFVFGFDTTSEQGRPNSIIPLAAVWDWDTGFMSTDDNEDPLEGIRDLPRSGSI
jgi:PLAT/LH2 domain-containing protein